MCKNGKFYDGYYYLGAGDIVQKGDEVFNDESLKWVETKNCIGKVALTPLSIYHLRFRRKNKKIFTNYKD